MIRRISVLILVILSGTLIAQSRVEERPEFKQYYDEYNVEGSFLLFDLKNFSYIAYNPERCEQRFIPASTFKIFNSLASLDAEVIENENTTIEWDGVERRLIKWNKDHTLKEAFKNSTVWFYQELARRIGEEKMQAYINEAGYGNKNISGGIDQFWLTGDLRISQKEQIEFLVNLYSGQLPFSERSIEIVKQIMISEEREGMVIRSKTGWGIVNDTDYGWWVGYITKGENVYFFANNIETSNRSTDFASARLTITKNILRSLGIY